MPLYGLGELVVQARATSHGLIDATPAAHLLTVVARIVDSTAALDAKRAEVSVQFSEKTDAFAVGDVPCKEIFTEATLIDVLGTGSACYWRSATELVVRLGVPGDADGRSDSLCALAQLGD